MLSFFTWFPLPQSLIFWKLVFGLRNWEWVSLVLHYFCPFCMAWLMWCCKKQLLCSFSSVIKNILKVLLVSSVIIIIEKFLLLSLRQKTRCCNRLANNEKGFARRCDLTQIFYSLSFSKYWSVAKIVHQYEHNSLERINVCQAKLNVLQPV